MKAPEDNIYLKYLIENEKDLLWGLTVCTVGFQSIEKYSDYPPGNHPSRYLFLTEKGRVLDEYQLIYITKGKGSFISTTNKRQEVKAGNMFLLFPGEWHSYKPDEKTGWDEYWIGFKGINIDNRVVNGFFNKQKPVFKVGLHDEIVQLYRQAILIAQKQKSGFQQMLAGIINYLLGFAYSYDKDVAFEDLNVTNHINRAKIIMIENLHREITPEEVAKHINMSYSWFRRVFKEYTGFAPAQYMQELKIQKGKELLTNTLLPVKEIAFNTGFDNADYFCTVFKKKTGYTPVNYRNFTRGENL